MSRIAFIGKSTASEDEQTALDYLGQILAYQDIELIVTPKGASNLAVIAGYRGRGHEPELGQGVLDRQPDQLIVFADDDLTTILDDKLPAWRKTNNILVEGDQELYHFLDYIVAHLEAEPEAVTA